MRPVVGLVDKRGVDAVLNAMAGLAAEQQAEVTVSTAHKAKGRQWARVPATGSPRGALVSAPGRCRRLTVGTRAGRRGREAVSRRLSYGSTASTKGSAPAPHHSRESNYAEQTYCGLSLKYCAPVSGGSTAEGWMISTPPMCPCAWPGSLVCPGTGMFFALHARRRRRPAWCRRCATIRQLSARGR